MYTASQECQTTDRELNNNVRFVCCSTVMYLLISLSVRRQDMHTKPQPRFLLTSVFSNRTTNHM